ncbi:Type II secretion system (T2SS), protein F [Amycolatopsis arida]|uniref:Type II secretion system (T2SS), protein F n=1 Tax=Amycolatopsis arida TaxID=587909 RepID=A0A1I6AYI6_9PSEU|nr:type II secretion system F family protein [Amycolatopsis arida]TDX83898.1 type II secretion system (T2SS) protein F [Amycolatopsis arida]SFQ73719.1 Type II secretion system (T2SS), protein F [Amycolatopsis arida]
MIHNNLSVALVACAVLTAPPFGATGARRLRRLWSIEPDRRRRPTRWSADRRWLSVPVAAVAGVLVGWPAGAGVALAAGTVCWLVVHRHARRRAEVVIDPLRLAAGWDLLAACLRGGLPVPRAVRAVARLLPEPAATALGTTAELLALGADPAKAWAPAAACPDTSALARAAKRTARSGAALAAAAVAEAGRIRGSTGDRAEARAQRAAVLVAGPLGLCFLPAFLCLGVAPVVIGLAGQLTVLT